MDGERLVYAMAAEAKTRSWNIPVANTSVLLLGPGCSMTTAAAQKLASERTIVAFTGGGGVPLFMGLMSEYSPTEYLIQWIEKWPDPKWRLSAAKYLAHCRCSAIQKLWPKYGFSPSPEVVTPRFSGLIDQAKTIEQLRGHEGDFAKSVYKEVARSTKLDWQGRQAGDEGQDLANSFLDQGNYLAYGIAGVVLITLGLPPGLAVNHGTTRAGGLVFDLADVIKDAIILPHAFDAATKGLRRQEFRQTVIDAIDVMEVLPHLFDVMKNVMAAVENERSDHVGMHRGCAG